MIKALAKCWGEGRGRGQRTCDDSGEAEQGWSDDKHQPQLQDEKREITSHGQILSIWIGRGEGKGMWAMIAVPEKCSPSIDDRVDQG